MIQANETRRNNYVLFENEIYQIDTIADEFPTLNTAKFGIGVVSWSNLQPIPLTEDILLNCGFKSTQIGLFQLRILNRGSINVHISSKRLNVELGTTGNYLFGDTDIKYLHQLQNLYFALTQQELNIQL